MRRYTAPWFFSSRSVEKSSEALFDDDNDEKQNGGRVEPPPLLRSAAAACYLVRVQCAALFLINTREKAAEL